jgi:hypothetical protein
MDKLLTMAKTFGQELSSADKELKQVKEELKELQDLLNKHKEGTLLKFQEVEIEDLKEENENLTKEIEEVKSCLEYDEEEAEIVSKDYLKKLEEENKKLKNDLRLCAEGLIPKDLIQRGIVEELKKKNEELHKTINTMACSSATTDFCMEHWIIHEQIDPKLLLGNWEEFYVKDENGKWIKKPKKKKTIKKKKKKEFDYGESDDWVWGYGNQQKSSEYVIHISGGGDGVSPNGFEDWVIKKVGGELKYYIRHGGNIPDEEQKEGIVPMKIWTCPEGNYVSFQLPNYEPREGEMNFEDWLDDELEDVEEKDE